MFEKWTGFISAMSSKSMLIGFIVRLVCWFFGFCWTTTKNFLHLSLSSQQPTWQSPESDDNGNKCWTRTLDDVSLNICLEQKFTSITSRCRWVIGNAEQHGNIFRSVYCQCYTYGFQVAPVIRNVTVYPIEFSHCWTKHGTMHHCIWIIRCSFIEPL